MPLDKADDAPVVGNQPTGPRPASRTPDPTRVAPESFRPFDCDRSLPRRHRTDGSERDLESQLQNKFLSGYGQVPEAHPEPHPRGAATARGRAGHRQRYPASWSAPLTTGRANRVWRYRWHSRASPLGQDQTTAHQSGSASAADSVGTVPYIERGNQQVANPVNRLRRPVRVGLV
jgi:hypothetical protein